MNTHTKGRRLLHAALAVLLSFAMVITTAEFPVFRDSATASAATKTQTTTTTTTTGKTTTGTTTVAGLKDISGHWAQKYIQKAVSYGFVKGYSDGRFLPDASITRAEFATMVNAAIGNTGTTALSFLDVKADSWYYDDVSKGVAAAYISGYSDTEFGPNNKITRQEAAVMLARIVPAAGVTSTLKAYGDYSKVASWATPAMQKMTGKKYIGAYNDGDLHPGDKLTRAQAAKIIDDILDNETIVKNNQKAVISGVTLKDTIYANKFTVASDVQDGSMTISNSTILGELAIEGGGSTVSTGVTLLNSRVAHATVNKLESPVRVYAKGETTVKNTDVYMDTTLENGTLTDNGDFGQGFQNVTARRAASLSLIGDFDNVDVNGAKVDLSLQNGTVNELTVYSGSSRANIDISDTASVGTANVSEDSTNFTGQGKIVRLNANADGITYETAPSRTVLGSNVTVAPALINSSEKKTFDITSSPSDGATGVAVGGSVRLSFSSQVRPYDQSDASVVLSGADAESLISIRKGSRTGTRVAFDATVAADGRSVTLQPSSALEPDTTYYVVIQSEELRDVNGNTNDEFVTTFTTGAAALDIAFSPSNGSTSVAMGTIPSITFKQPVVRADSASSSVTPAYLKSSVLRVQKQGSGETARSDVSFTATIDATGKVITITPDAALQEEAAYYITINADTLKYSTDLSAVPATTSTFTTISDSLSGRSAKATGSDSAQLDYKALDAGTVYGIIFPVEELGSDKPTAANIKAHDYVSSVTSDQGHYASAAVKAGSTGSLTFTDLKPSTSYYIYEVLYDADGNANSVFSQKVTTTAKSIALSTLKIAAKASATDTPDSDSYDAITLSGSSGVYYIGTRETILSVQAGASTSLSPAYTFTSTVGTTSNLSVGADKKGYADVTIPAGTGSPGTINVTVTSTNDSSYAPTTYTITLKRVQPGISSVTFNGMSVDTYTDDTQANNTVANSLKLDGSSSTISMIVNLADTANSGAVAYTLYRYSKTSPSWQRVGAATHTSGEVLSVGTYQLPVNAAGYYKIVTTAPVNGPSLTSTRSTETVTRYLSVDFTK